MADQFIQQTDFSAGIHRVRRGPENSVYDAVNALIDDQGLLYRRGGSVSLSSVSGFNFQGVAALNLPPGQRIAGWTASAFAVLDNSNVPLTLSAFGPAAYTRGVTVGPVWLAPEAGGLFIYGGSRKNAAYSTGTAAATFGSKTLTGTGTAWAANVEPGMIYFDGLNGLYAVVESVQSNTSITLRDPWPHGTASGMTYEFRDVLTHPGTPVTGTPAAVAAAGTPPRLMIAYGNRVYFTPRGNPYSLTWGNFHELPADAQITGMEGQGDTCLVFTTRGVWTISNLNFDPLDDAGNEQHFVQEITKDVILLDNSGVTAWLGHALVPATNGIYLLAPGEAPVPIHGGILPLYADYVRQGYQTGLGAVYRGHYLLPILNGPMGAIVDVLVCRLDRGFAWTRWAGHPAKGAFATPIGSTTRAPKLLGQSGQFVTDLNSCFAPSVTVDDDADGSDHQLTVETRDFVLLEPSRRRPGRAQAAQVTYELTGTGNTVGVQWSTGQEGSSYTALTAVRGGGESDGTGFSVWPINKARNTVRLKITQTGAAAKTVLRDVTLRVQRSGL